MPELRPGVGQGMQWREVPAANDTSGTGSLVPYTETFAYDHAGNLLTTGHTGTVNWTRTQSYAAASNRLATSVDSNGTFNATHDAFGNMLAMPGLDVMEWDAFGNLHRTSADDTAHADKTFYVYDGAGQRVRKVTEKWDSSVDTHVRKSDTLYLGGFELVRTWTGTEGTTLDDEIETLHIMDADARLAIVETQTAEAGDPPTTIAAKWRYQLDDLIGSSAVELGRDGQVISYEEFHPYGTTALLIDTGGEGFRKRYRWSGKERDAESGLVYFGARYFAPWLGRWASADPAGLVDGNPYRVVRGNPVGLTESDGRQVSASQMSESEYHEVALGWLPDFLTRAPAAFGRAVSEAGGEAVGFAAEVVSDVWEDVLQGVFTSSPLAVLTMRGHEAGDNPHLDAAFQAREEQLRAAASGDPDALSALGVEALGAAAGHWAFGRVFPGGGGRHAPTDGAVDDVSSALASSADDAARSSRAPAHNAAVATVEGVPSTAGGPGSAAPELAAAAQRAVRSLEARLSEHEAKLAAYRENPFAFDNRGDLARNADRPDVQQRIIDGRIRHLEGEIRNFRQQLERLRSGSDEP